MESQQTSNISGVCPPVEFIAPQVKIRLTPDGRMSLNDAAKYLGVKPGTLYAWGSAGKGPKQCRLGSRIFYKKTDLDSLLEEGGFRE